MIESLGSPAAPIPSSSPASVKKTVASALKGAAEEERQRILSTTRAVS